MDITATKLFRTVFYLTKRSEFIQAKIAKIIIEKSPTCSFVLSKKYPIRMRKKYLRLHNARPVLVTSGSAGLINDRLRNSNVSQEFF